MDSEKEEMSDKEKRVRAVTRIYYSNPKVQEAILNFALDREVVPRYFEGFGKRPDMLQYISDVNGLVRKGATSFHASEELWQDPLQLSSDSTQKDLENLRKGWDLLIDIDSPFLDCSKIAAQLIIAALEQHGVKNYGIKFSGSKGFHLMVSGKAFPREFNGEEGRKMFPSWPRAICGYLMSYIREDYNRLASEILTDIGAIQRRTKLSKEQLEEVMCKICGKPAQKGSIANFVCPVCSMTVQRKNAKITKRRLKCLSNSCAGVLEQLDGEEFHYCENCIDPDNENLQMNSSKHPENFEKSKGVSAEKVASPDLVLVASRHLFRMPYSLHEKTALASVVLTKEELKTFSPMDADPLRVKIKEFMPKNEEGEAKNLLAKALDWSRGREVMEKAIEEKRFSKFKGKKFDDVELKGVTDDMFPQPIKKLLKGLEEGRKRGLFVLLTFLRSTGFSPEEINKRVRDWNERNEPPLKEGYVRSQIEWHLKQTKKILPPNYSNEAFYRDIGILDKKPETKNPLVDVMRKVRRRSRE
ncbi:MAG: primase C-terminal domain-containing protein [archaeon]